MAEPQTSLVEADAGAVSTFERVVTGTLRSPQFGSLIAMAAAVTLGVGLIMYSITPDYTPIYDRMSEKDSAQVLEILGEAGTDYRLDPSSGVVLVPRESLPSVRMQLAAAGLPSSSELGLEMLQQESSLGTSQFIESARYQHALETELSRTISSMRNIKAARVHLALPKQSVFLRNRAESTASVMLKPYAGRTVEKGQVASIVNLVASSIPYLESNNVTVVDQFGRLLSGIDNGLGSDLTNAQFEYTRRVEALLSQRIEALLTPLVGDGRIRASVTADIDFTVNEQTQELYEGDPAQVRSEEIRRSAAGATGTLAAGVPGALTNQPNGLDPLATQNGGESLENQSTRNYELDKTIRHTRQSPAAVRRLSAAVIIDNRVEVDEDGVEQSIAVSEEELESLTALAREAIGFDEARGDSVIVFNQQFQPAPELEAPEPMPFWQQLWHNGIVKQVFAALAVLLLIFMVLRPAMKNLSLGKQQALDEEALAALTDGTSQADDGENSENGQSSGQDGSDENAENNDELLPATSAAYSDVLEVARTMANEDPERVARVVREWVADVEEE